MNRVKKGFTLIELLVVISIIAVLMSIMMPALTKVREQAKRVTGRANLRQQGLACSMYMMDYKNKFPYKEIDGYNDDQNGIISGFSWGGKNGADPGANQETRLLNPYVGKSGKVDVDSEDAGLEIFKCPSDKGSTAGTFTPTIERKPSDYYALGCSYTYNVAPDNTLAWGVGDRRVDKIRNSDRVVLASCRSFKCYSFDYNNVGNKFMNYFWHNKKEDGWGNVLFVDMHVDYLLATYDNPDHMEGDGWTFVSNLSEYRKTHPVSH